MLQSMTQIQSFLLTIEQANALLARSRSPKGFGAYLRERKSLVVAACVLLAAVPLACTAGTLGFFGQMHPVVMLLGMVLAPFVLIGATLVTAFLLFSWLETRALEQALGHRAGRALPVVPWLPAGVFLLLPLAMLGVVAPLAALAAVLVAVAAPLAYARLERAGGFAPAAWYFYQAFGRLTNRGRARAHSRRSPAAPRRGRSA